jgi:hypothetical protein
MINFNMVLVMYEPNEYYKGSVVSDLIFTIQFLAPLAKSAELVK